MSLRRVCFALVCLCSSVLVCFCLCACVQVCFAPAAWGESQAALTERGVFHLPRHDDEDEKEEVEDAPLLASIVGSSIRVDVFSLIGVSLTSH